MKLFKIIDILRDRDNWKYDSINCRYTHIPTGIYFFTGIIIWNSKGEEIYSTLFGSTFVLPIFINKIKKHLEEKSTESLDEIYQKWIDNKEDF
jgi:hypothetical protein